MLFIGTLRFNIDPFGRYTDGEIWEALEKVRMAATVRAHPLQLGMPVHEGGCNLSSGEAQCVSMARAILQKARIYVMDEATASVDYSTDNAIQVYSLFSVSVVSFNLYSIVS